MQMRPDFYQKLAPFKTFTYLDSYSYTQHKFKTVCIVNVLILCLQEGKGNMSCSFKNVLVQRITTTLLHTTSFVNYSNII